MPHIIVVADGADDWRGGQIMLRERVSAADLASAHFSRHLLDRLRWAVGDAGAAEDAVVPSSNSHDRRVRPKNPRDAHQRRHAQPPASVVTTAS
jgi:hypothetical protein